MAPQTDIVEIVTAYDQWLAASGVEYSEAGKIAFYAGYNVAVERAHSDILKHQQECESDWAKELMKELVGQ